jgi:hypothetical protein
MNGHVTLVARWAIFGREVEDLLHLEKSLYREAVSGDAYKDLVSAYSRVIEKLCRDVAQVLEGTISIPSD